MATAERLAVGEEIVGGGPEDPFADAAAAATLGVGLAATALKPGHSKPTTAASGPGRSDKYRVKPTESYDEECEEQFKRDSINCQIVGAVKGRRKQRVCDRVAMYRYSECLADGPSNVRTPFYWGN